MQFAVYATVLSSPFSCGFSANCSFPCDIAKIVEDRENNKFSSRVFATILLLCAAVPRDVTDLAAIVAPYRAKTVFGKEVTIAEASSAAIA